jgi:hypothetical protein
MNLKTLTFGLILLTASPCLADYNPCDSAIRSVRDADSLMRWAADPSTKVLIERSLSDAVSQIEECREKLVELEKKLERERVEKDIEALQKRYGRR